MIFTKELEEKIRKYIDDNRELIIDFYRDLVNHEGKDGEIDNLRKTASFLKKNFELIGMSSELIEVGGGHAPIVTGVLNPKAPGKEMVFTGHYDTVFPTGTKGKNPFKTENGKAFGLGVCDMKGGIVISFFVAKALKEFGFKTCPIRLFFVGDEEANREGGNTIELIKKYASGILVAFNMENRNESGEICIARQGVCEYKITVKGVAAHPGKAFDEGRNAIEEMSHKIIALQAITPKRKDRQYSVSVDVIKGGIVTNAIPDHCEAYADVRFWNMQALEECESKMFKVCSDAILEGTETELKRMDILIPFETTENVRKAYKALKEVSDAIGGTITGSVATGGACDAAYFSSVGAKVLCQCGITGAYNHSVREYARLDSLYEGIRLFIFAAYNFKLFE